MDLEIQTYWNVETLYYVFNAVAAMMASANFQGLMKMVFLIGLIVGLLSFNNNKNFEMGLWFIQGLIFVTVLCMPIARVIITDKTNLEPPRTVANVPWSLATAGYFSNVAFSFLARSYETVMGVPDDLGLQRGDVGFGHRILRGVNNAIVRDPGLRADLIQFVKECTVYDVKDGVITPQQIMNETDTWSTIFTNTSPARFVTYDTLTANPTTVPCTDAATILSGRVNTAVTAAQTFYGKQYFTRAQSDGIAQGMFISAVGTSYDWILSSSQNASDALKQSMFNNLWKEAGSELPTLLNDPSRVAEVNALTASAIAARQADGSNSTLSLLAQETLPHMRNWVEALLVVLFPVMVILILIVPRAAAGRVIAGYMMGFAWIGLWPVLFAVINHLSLMHLKYKLGAQQLAAGVPFQMTDVFDATIGNEQTMIGYLVVSVPFIAGAIVRMGQGGFMSLAGQMMSGFSSIGSAAGSSTAAGNFSAGQVGMDTANVNSTSMHKFDSNMNMGGNGSNIMLGNGTMLTQTGNGTVASSALQSRMLTAMQQGMSLDAGSNREAHTTEIGSTGVQESLRHSDASTLSTTTGVERNSGSFQSAGNSTGTDIRGGTNSSYSAGEFINDNKSETSGFHKSAGASDIVGANVGVHGGINTGGEGQQPGASPKDIKRLENGVLNGGGTQDQLNAGMRSLNGASAPGGESDSSMGIQGGLSFQTQKNYTSAQSRDRSVSIQHGNSEDVREGYDFSMTGSMSVTNSSGMQSGTTNRRSSDASLSNTDEYSSVKDSSMRTESGLGERVSTSKTASYSERHDYMADPGLASAVASRNGMSAVRFAQLPENRIADLTREYLSEKGSLSAVTSMPSSQSGSTMPNSSSDLSGGGVGNNIAQGHGAKVAATGFSGINQVKTSGDIPSLASSAQSNIQSMRDGANANSIGTRTENFDRNVSDWASHDKEVGAGRANPLGVVEDMEKADLGDSLSKAAGVITGGGDKHDANSSRVEGNSVDIRK